MVETDNIKLELLPSGILLATYKKQTVITLEIGQHIVKTRLAFTGLEPLRPVLMYNAGIVEVEYSARKYLSSGEAISGLSAAAVLVDKATSAIVMNFIMAIERPKIPVKLFSSEKKAFRWLETFL